MKLSEGGFNKCLSTVARLHSIDLKPLRVTTTAARVCVCLCVLFLSSELFLILFSHGEEGSVNSSLELGPMHPFKTDMFVCDIYTN